MPPKTQKINKFDDIDLGGVSYLLLACLASPQIPLLGDWISRQAHRRCCSSTTKRAMKTAHPNSSAKRSSPLQFLIYWYANLPLISRHSARARRVHTCQQHMTTRHHKRAAKSAKIVIWIRDSLNFEVCCIVEGKAVVLLRCLGARTKNIYRFGNF